jgi:hypothetical protein
MAKIVKLTRFANNYYISGMKKQLFTLCFVFLGIMVTHVAYGFDQAKVPKTEYAVSVDYLITDVTAVDQPVALFSFEARSFEVIELTNAGNNSFAVLVEPVQTGNNRLAIIRDENLAYQSPFVDNIVKWKYSVWYNS